MSFIDTLDKIQRYTKLLGLNTGMETVNLGYPTNEAGKRAYDILRKSPSFFKDVQSPEALAYKEADPEGYFNYVKYTNESKEPLLQKFVNEIPFISRGSRTNVDTSISAVQLLYPEKYKKIHDAELKVGEPAPDWVWPTILSGKLPKAQAEAMGTPENTVGKGRQVGAIAFRTASDILSPILGPLSGGPQAIATQIDPSMQYSPGPGTDIFAGFVAPPIFNKVGKPMLRFAGKVGKGGISKLASKFRVPSEFPEGASTPLPSHRLPGAATELPPGFYDNLEGASTPYKNPLDLGVPIGSPSTVTAKELLFREALGNALNTPRLPAPIEPTGIGTPGFLGGKVSANPIELRSIPNPIPGTTTKFVKTPSSGEAVLRILDNSPFSEISSAQTGRIAKKVLGGDTPGSVRGMFRKSPFPSAEEIPTLPTTAEKLAVVEAVPVKPVVSNGAKLVSEVEPNLSKITPKPAAKAAAPKAAAKSRASSVKPVDKETAKKAIGMAKKPKSGKYPSVEELIAEEKASSRVGTKKALKQAGSRGGKKSSSMKKEK